MNKDATPSTPAAPGTDEYDGLAAVGIGHARHLRDQLAALRARCAALEQDRERLVKAATEYRDVACHDDAACGPITYAHILLRFRAAIDAARQAAPHAGAGEGRG